MKVQETNKHEVAVEAIFAHWHGEGHDRKESIEAFKEKWALDLATASIERMTEDEFAAFVEELAVDGRLGIERRTVENSTGV
jgi:hypothetical protein